MGSKGGLLTSLGLSVLVVVAEFTPLSQGYLIVLTLLCLLIPVYMCARLRTSVFRNAVAAGSVSGTAHMFVGPILRTTLTDHKLRLYEALLSPTTSTRYRVLIIVALLAVTLGWILLSGILAKLGESLILAVSKAQQSRA